MSKRDVNGGEQERLELGRKVQRGIGDDIRSDLYEWGEDRDVILPVNVVRRFDAVLEGSKQAVLDMKAGLDAASDSLSATCASTATAISLLPTCWRTSTVSPNVEETLDNFEFRIEIPWLFRAVALGTVIEKLTSPAVNLSPAPVRRAAGSVRHPGP